ncbi:SID-1 A [Fasciola gigantica]|uniref:SID-1 A n=1 Tax=Fasciola gigantica TaxID=46835 RepID=A0A504YWY6_FASGI|nr:SID-1 A [Fasciola gigantica]
MIVVLVLVLLLAPAYAVTEAELDKRLYGSVSVNQTDEYDFSLNETSVQEYVIRVHVLNIQPQKNSPLLIVIKQQQHVLSFEVPAIINEIISHSNVSRTLCPISVTPDKIATLIIGISSFTSEPIPYMVRAEWVRNFD